MSYLVYLSNYGGGASRYYQIANTSVSSYLDFVISTSVYYSGSANAGRASVRSVV